VTSVTLLALPQSDPVATYVYCSEIIHGDSHSNCNHKLISTELVKQVLLKGQLFLLYTDN